MTDRDPGPGNAAPGDAGRGDDAFAEAAAALLRESAQNVDAATASRLNRARQAALDQYPRRPRLATWLAPALSTAAVLALAVGLWLNRAGAPAIPAPLTPAVESTADLDLLLADDSLEMLENLDFYAWLDADRSDDELRAALESAG